MVKPTSEKCKGCNFNTHDKCHRCCEHMISEFARIEKEKLILSKALQEVIYQAGDPEELKRIAEQALQNAKS